MKKMCAANLGVLLLALHLLSSQVVRAQDPTDAPMSTAANNYTMAPTATLMNVTSKDKSGSGRADASALLLLLPLALAASLLHGWSQ